MAQPNPEEKVQETNPERENFKFNAHAPEFVPRSHTQMPISGYFYPSFRFLDGSVVGSDWFYVSDHEPYCLFPNSSALIPNSSKNVLSDDLPQKIVKQVEYLFSDLSLMANDTMAKHVSKDPEGYVPIPVIASLKKIKALVADNHLLVQALCSSSKLVVSKDCKKVKRTNRFTEQYKDDLQCRTVVVENLPDDHSYQNLEKIFGVVGSVKAIRLCHPPEANASRSKNDVIISNKLHALVEYENADIAGKAVEKLNDERNWRKGMRVRVMLRCSPKSVLKVRRTEFDVFPDDDEIPSPDSPEDSWQTNSVEVAADGNGEESPGSSRKAAPRGRGKSKGRGQCHSGRGLLMPPSTPSCNTLSDALAKQSSNKGPRMPDGTRGFTMGRGKPLISSPAPAIASAE